MERFGSLLVEMLGQTTLTEQFRATLRYLFDADVRAPSTFHELAANIKKTKIKRSVMSIAEQLRQEGREEGALIGQIQTFQELLGLPVSAPKELIRKGSKKMQALLRGLKTQLHSNLRAKSSHRSGATRGPLHQ